MAILVVPAMGQEGAPTPAPGLQIEAKDPSAKLKVEIQAGSNVQRCERDVTDRLPCSLSSMGPTLATVRVSGSQNFSRDIQLPATGRIRIEQRDYLMTIVGLGIGAAGAALIMVSDIGSVGFTLGAGILAGGTAAVTLDLMTDRNLLVVEPGAGPRLVALSAPPREAGRRGPPRPRGGVRVLRLLAVGRA